MNRFLLSSTAALALMVVNEASADTFTINTTTGNTVTQTGTLGNSLTNPPTTVEVLGNGTGTTPGGTFVFNNTANNFSGGTLIIGNAIAQINADADLGDATGTVTLGNSTSTGTLDLLYNTSTAVGVTSGRSIVLGAEGGTIIADTTGIPSGTTVISLLAGVISGGNTATNTGGGLTISGGGILELSGINTYSGGTTILGGTTIEIAADTALGATTGIVSLGNGTVSFLNTTGITLTHDFGVTVGTFNTSAGTVTINTSGALADGNGSNSTLQLNGAGALIVDADQSAFTGTITVSTGTTTSGSTSTTGTGTLVLGDSSGAGAILGGSVNVNAGGTLKGYGTVDGAITNSGIVEPGYTGAGTLTVDGNYTQTAKGSLVVDVTPTVAGSKGVSSVLNVGGTATFVSGAGVTFDYQPGRYKAGTTYTFLIAPAMVGTLTGTNTTGASSLSIGFNETMNCGATACTLIIANVSKLPETATIYPEITSTLLDNVQNTNDILLTRLSDNRTGASVDHMKMSEYDNHRAGLSAGASPYGAWAKLLGGFGSTDSSGSAPGYTNDGGGFVAGIDGEFADGLAAGVAFGYTYTAVKENVTNAKGTINTPFLAAYSGWWVGPIAIDAAVDFGYASTDASRPINQISASAASTYNAAEVGAALQASSTFRLGPITLTPAAGAKYALIREDKITETGGGAYNLFTGTNELARSLRPFVAVTAAAQIQMGLHTKVEPEIRVGYEDEQASTRRYINVSPVNDPALFTFEGVRPAQGALKLSGGVTVETGRHLGYFVDGSAIRGSNFGDYTFDAGLRYRF